MKKYCNAIILQNSPLNRRVKQQLSAQQESWLQVELFPLPRKRQKPQISSIPGISPKDPKRYRVMLGDVEIATQLTSDEAFALIKGGAR